MERMKNETNSTLSPDIRRLQQQRSPPAHYQQQQQQTRQQQQQQSPRSRKGNNIQVQHNNSNESRRIALYVMLSSALTLALSSLYFSTTVCMCFNQQQEHHPLHDMPPTAAKSSLMTDCATAVTRSDDNTNTTITKSAAIIAENKQQDDITNAITTSTTTTTTDVVVSSKATTTALRKSSKSENVVVDEKNNSQRKKEPSIKESSTVPNSDADAGADIRVATTTAATITATNATTTTTENKVDENRDEKSNKKHEEIQQNKEHPYWGAKDEHGQLGHVHDPTAAHHDRRAFSISNEEREQGLCEAPPGKPKSIEGGIMGWRALKKIHISGTGAAAAAADDDKSSEKKPEIRLFCSVYTHTGATEQTNALLETWAPRCDGLLFASNATNVTAHHVHIPHKSVAEGQYKGIWQRVRAMMVYLYQNFLDDYDYFHFCGDDTYVLVENLKAFLSSAQVAKNATNNGERPLFAGYWSHLKWWGDEYPEDFYFLSGGPGYTLSRTALKMFVEQALPTCRAQEDDPFEDLNVAWCFHHVLNISGIDTRDETGAQRYHPMSAEMHAKFPAQAKYGPPSFMIRKTKEHMEKQFGFPTIYGLDDISNNSVAFHCLKTPVELRRYEMLLYGTGRDQCNDGNRTSSVAR